MKLRDRIVWILKGILFGLLFAALFSLAVRVLWNWLCPELFHLPALSLLQAFGLIVLSRLLLGRFGAHHPHHSPRPWPFRKGADFFGKDDPRRDITQWGRYGAWWKAEGHERYEAWLHREAPSEQAKRD